ncbi:hypothetical protein ATKI12_0159 [Kitasatospora sp. Ki12]|uniref:hypothetical protein n=1 Tax=Kitasatospora xanthocidica TaxID=83382 RepID=UPI001672D6A0|nr:hypothetical protein [Kitasatospora xanthocidica]GHF50149.1 hypothetical protein GCM10018790_29890 [Kitasatospora xanthocidica]
MAQTLPGRPTLPGKRNLLAAALGVGQLLLAAPMLATLVTGGLVVAVMGLAAGASALALLPLVLLLAAGPLLGLGITALIVRGQRFPRGVGFPVVSFGLLLGTAVEYFGWIRPALG